MGLPQDIRSIFASHTNGLEGMVEARNTAMRWKSGQELLNFYKFVEIFFVEEKLKLGKSPQDINDFIRNHSHWFTRHWTLAKVTKMAEKFSPKVTFESPTTEFDFDNERCFGVEIELLCRESRTSVAEYLMDHGHQCIREERTSYYIKDVWKVVTDGSLSADGMELVSPVLKGKAGLEELKEVCKLLKKLHCKIDNTCGLHIHHQVKSPGVDDIKILKSVTQLYHHFCYTFDKMLPRSRRNNCHCGHYSEYEIKTILATAKGIPSVDRHRSINIQAYLRHGTMEFRQHSGSIEADKIINWIHITQAVMNRGIELAKHISDISKFSFKKDLKEELRLKQEIKDYIDQRIEKFNDEKAA